MPHALLIHFGSCLNRDCVAQRPMRVISYVGTTFFVGFIGLMYYQKQAGAADRR